MKKKNSSLTEEIVTIPYDKDAVIYKIACQTCGQELSLQRGRFPICDDCLKDLREILKERRLEKEKAEFKLKSKKRCAELEGRYFR